MLICFRKSSNIEIGGVGQVVAFAWGCFEQKVATLLAVDSFRPLGVRIKWPTHSAIHPQNR